MRLIGVSAKAGSGKSEFAKIAVEEFGAILISFASGVKQEVEEFLKETGIEYKHENLYGSQEQKEQLLNISPKTFSYIVYIKPEFESYLNKFAVINGSSWTHYYTFSARSLLQWWGTEYRRSQDTNYWVNKALRDLKEGSFYIIDDCRFKNEAEGILKSGGKLVRIEREGKPKISNENHPSEIDLDDWTEWDALINNDKDLETYRYLVRSIIRDFNEC